MAAGGEMIEMLARALRRSSRAANDRGMMGRARDARQVFIDEPRGDYVRGDVFPERLWERNNGLGVARDLGRGTARPANPTGIITAEDQAMIDALPPAERAAWLREAGMADEFALTPYEQAVVRSRNPKGAARERWGVDDPVARMALIGAGGVGGGLTLREALRNRWNA